MICGYRKYFGSVGFAEVSWPLARVLLEPDFIEVRSPLESFRITREQVGDVQTQLFCARMYYRNGAQEEELKVYGIGADLRMKAWWEGS